MKNIKGLSKTPHKTHRHTQQCGDYQRERGWEELEEGKGDKPGLEGDLTWGGEHIIQYTEDVL